MASPVDREFGKFLTVQEQLEERIFLGFRLEEGIDIQSINADFDIDFERKYADVLQKYSDYLVKTERGYKLSNDSEHNGFLMSNIILSEFL